MVGGDKYYTAEVLASEASISLRTAQRRLQFATPAHKISVGGAGRATHYYDSRVLVLFPEIKPEIFETEVVIVEAKKVNPCKGVTRILSEKLLTRLIQETFANYINQGYRKGLRRSCEDTIKYNWAEIEADLKASGKYNYNSKKNGEQLVRDLEFMQNYWYMKVINRQDKHNVGVAIAENWAKRWEAKHQVNQSNGRLATASYNMLEILERAGIISPGHGAGAIWVIDGTQFDSWVVDENKYKTFNYLCVMDGVTKMPLWLEPLDNGETIECVAKALWGAVQVHGVPKLGIVADNGRAFRSREIQELVTSWYSPEDLASFKNCPLRRELFYTKDGPQRGAIIYPLAGIPRFPFKSSIERSFDEMNRHQMTNFALSYSGTRDSRYLTHEIGSVPKKALAGALSKSAAFADFLYYVYTDYINRSQNGSEYLGWIKSKYKQKPTPANAWTFYGGKLNIDIERSENKQLSLIPEARLEADENGYFYYQYCIADKKHRISAGENYVSVKHNNISDTFVSERLNASTWGREFVAVIDSYNPAECHLFIDNLRNNGEESPKKIIDKSGLLEYFCTAQSTKIRELADARRVRSMTGRARRSYENEIQNYEVEMTGEVIVANNRAARNLENLRYSSNNAEAQSLGVQTLIPQASEILEQTSGGQIEKNLIMDCINVNKLKPSPATSLNEINIDDLLEF